MDAVKYLEEKARMCKRAGDCCSFCDFGKEMDTVGGCDFCEQYAEEFPEKAVEIVERWSKENPRKTMLMDLKEKYPNARVGLMCPSILGYDNEAEDCPDGINSCDECWNREMKKE